MTRLSYQTLRCRRWSGSLFQKATARSAPPALFWQRNFRVRLRKRYEKGNSTDYPSLKTYSSEDTLSARAAGAAKQETRRLRTDRQICRRCAGAKLAGRPPCSRLQQGAKADRFQRLSSRRHLQRLPSPNSSIVSRLHPIAEKFPSSLYPEISPTMLRQQTPTPVPHLKSSDPKSTNPQSKRARI